MSKIFYSMLFMAVAALTIVSCEKPAPENGQNDSETKGGIVFIAGNPEVEVETRTQFGPDFAPYWSANDEIKAFGEYDPTTILTFKGDNASAAKTANFTMEPLQYWETDLRQSTNKLFVYKGSAGSAFNADGHAGFKMVCSQTPSMPNQFDSRGDILVAKPVAIDPDTDYTANPITLNFKRLSGIVRLNLMDKTTEGQFVNGKTVKSVTMTTNDPANDFSGKLVGDFYTGEFVKEAASSHEKLTVTPQNYQVGAEGQSIYMSVLPTVLAEGEVIEMTIVFTDGSESVKQLPAPKGGINVEAAKITTFNVGFYDSEMPAPGEPQMNPNTGAITMGAPGSLTVEHIHSALAIDPAKLAISGDINASDINSILTVVRGLEASSAIDLDLTNANIKGDKNAEYEDFVGNLQTITRDNVIPENLFSCLDRPCYISSLELPKSLTEIGSWAFNEMPCLRSCTIQHKVTSIGEALFAGSFTIALESNSPVTLKVLTPDAALDVTFFDGNYLGNEMVDLILNKEWVNGSNPPDGNYWVITEVPWKSITYVTVDENGDIVE